MKRRPVSEVIGQLNSWLMEGFAVMVTTGLLLFGGELAADGTPY